MRLISLSTIPPRFQQLGPTLASILAQTAQVDEIQLCIPKRYRRFPDYDGSVPAVPSGIRIVRPDIDLGPASKVLHAVREHRGRATRILFCDDDRIYPPGWARGLFEQQDARPDDCVALFGKSVGAYPSAAQPRAARRNAERSLGFRLWRLKASTFKRLGISEQTVPFRWPIKRAGYVDLFQGWGGVVVRPAFFDEAAYDIPPVAWAVDDVWLSGMLARNNVRIWVPQNMIAPGRAPNDHVEALLHNVVDGATRPDVNAAAIRMMQYAFHIWV